MVRDRFTPRNARGRGQDTSRGFKRPSGFSRGNTDPFPKPRLGKRLSRKAFGETAAKPSGAVALDPFTLLNAKLRAQNILNDFSIIS